MHESKIAIENNENIKTQLTVDAIKYRNLQLEDMSTSPSLKRSNYIECYANLVQLQSAIGLIIEAEEKPNYYSSALVYNKISKLFIEQKDDYNIGLYYKQKELAFQMKHEDSIATKTELGIDCSNKDLAEIHESLGDIYVHLGQYGLAQVRISMSQIGMHRARTFGFDEFGFEFGSKVRVRVRVWT
ncbi:unnamed protein product [Adineta ricciae]|uniref:Uncharacterized protein n=1 Tax=Adineta ricciae TaxID=249248 RepID=A0A816GX26_ADIRI|nr:unnamed protein product [Adineta ricciae]